MNIVIQGLIKIYKTGEQETVALRGAKMSVDSGENLAITGRSGAGKSTLLNILGGLAQPSAGRILMDGTDIARLSEPERAGFRLKNMGIVFQKDNLIPFLTALENVMLPLRMAGSSHAAQKARRLLGEVGLAERLKHKPAMLSGGERQRVAIATALANRPRLLLADELTGELDSSTSAMIMALLRELSKEHHLTMIVVTHNEEVASGMERCIKMSDGKLQDKLQERKVLYV